MEESSRLHDLGLLLVIFRLQEKKESINYIEGWMLLVKEKY